VRERLGDDISITYNKNGAPVLGAESIPVEDLSNPLGYIGVSHTKGWVAVVWSPEPCAMDIELAGRKLSPAAAERYSINNISDWCAIEARYKYAGLTGREPNPKQIGFLPHPDLAVAVIR
jgi:phosphopantetheinyl transferase